MIETDYRPLIQLELDPEPQVDVSDGSYLNFEGFSGTAYQLTDEEYSQIREIVRDLA